MPERVLIWREKRTRIQLMAWWKYEPYAWNSKTSMRRRQRDETATSDLFDLTQRWRPKVSRVSFRARPVLPVCLSCVCLLLQLCIVAIPVYTDPTEAEIVKYPWYNVSLGVVL